jgi:hypothetical protein
LSRAIEQLSPARGYLSRLRASGGNAEFFIGVFGNRNFGVELPTELLAAAAHVGIALSFDVYP